MEKILDFKGPIDVNLLDMIVNALYFGDDQQVMMSLQFSVQMQ